MRLQTHLFKVVAKPRAIECRKEGKNLSLGFNEATEMPSDVTPEGDKAATDVIMGLGWQPALKQRSFRLHRPYTGCRSPYRDGMHSLCVFRHYLTIQNHAGVLSKPLPTLPLLSIHLYNTPPTPSTNIQACTWAADRINKGISPIADA